MGWTFYASVIIAVGVPAAARILKAVTTRQGIAMFAALWALAQPPYTWFLIRRAFTVGDTNFVPMVVMGIVGGIIAAAAGMCAAFVPMSVRYQRLLYLAATIGALMAIRVWEFQVFGLVLSILAALAFAGLTVSPRPFEYPAYVPRRLARRRPR